MRPASKQCMDGASHLTTVHALARQADAVMLEENSDRFVTMEGHEISSCMMPRGLPRAMRRHRATRPACRMGDATAAAA
jgi:hypothetical protein